MYCMYSSTCGDGVAGDLGLQLVLQALQLVANVAQGRVDRLSGTCMAQLRNCVHPLNLGDWVKL